MSYVGPEKQAEIMKLIKAGFKQCGHCKNIKPLSTFSPQPRIKCGYRPECHECHNLQSHAKYHGDPVYREAILVKQREANKTERRRTYNRNYQRARARRAREEQANRPRSHACEICCDDKNTMRFDHDHSTGRFRGWLCNRCNRVLGMCKDDPALLISMASYLEMSNAEIKENSVETR